MANKDQKNNKESKGKKPGDKKDKKPAWMTKK